MRSKILVSYHLLFLREGLSECHQLRQVGEWILFYTAWSYRIEVWHLQAVDIQAILIAHGPTYSDLSSMKWKQHKSSAGRFVPVQCTEF